MDQPRKVAKPSSAVSMVSSSKRTLGSLEALLDQKEKREWMNEWMNEGRFKHDFFCLFLWHNMCHN